MHEKLTPYIRTHLHLQSFKKQYTRINDNPAFEADDPLAEDSHEPVKGLIHKYHNRALIKVSYECASHCRFCTRIRQIGKKSGRLNQDDINNIIDYLRTHSEINDVILSGGDPLYTPEIGEKILENLSEINHVKIIRIGTRLPLQLPDAVYSPAVKRLFHKINVTVTATTKSVIMLLHIEHPDELTKTARGAIKELKKLPVMLLSQSVFLKNINNDTATLKRLFSELLMLSVKPYYIYHCDNVAGLEPFICDIEEEKQIMRELRQSLSGPAIPIHIIDSANGKEWLL